jgi:hypothetical protein
MLENIIIIIIIIGRLCGLMIRVPGYRSRGPRFDSRRNQIFWDVVGLKRGPLILMRITQELFQGNSGSSLENRNQRSWGSVALTTYSSVADYRPRSLFIIIIIIIIIIILIIIFIFYILYYIHYSSSWKNLLLNALKQVKTISSQLFLS